MEEFWKAAALVILTVILGTAIGKTEKDIALVLTAVACCILSVTALGYMSEILDFLRNLSREALGENPIPETLLQIAGVSLLTELTCLISSDAGNTALGKAMQILGNAVILALSVPVLESFFAMIQEMLRYS